MVDVTYGEVQGDNIISTHLGLGNIDGRFTVKITPFLWRRINKASNTYQKGHGEST